MARDIFGKLIKYDFLTGKKIPKKQIKKDILEENKRKGKSAEESYKMRAQLAGYEVERTGRGHDFKLSKRDFMSGKKKFIGYREIKSSHTASVSKLQKEKAKEMRGKHKIIRETSSFW